MSFNTYGSKSKTFGYQPVPVWIKVDGVKQGGGTLVVASSFATEYPVGTVIPAGTPVKLDKSGGTATPLYTYELAKAVLATDTVVVVKGNSYLPKPKAGNYVMPAPATAATTGTGLTCGAVAVNADGNYEITIVANAWGTPAKGAIYVACDKSGASAVLATQPNGLVWHDVVVEEGDTAATIGVVDEGRILADRVPPIPPCVAALIPNVILEREV